MRTGKTLVEMAAELERQLETRKDFAAPAAKLDFVPVPTNEGKEVNDVALRMDSNGTYPLTNHAHGQVADDLKIPKAYYDRMRTNAPQLLAENVNHWLHAEGHNHQIRTLDHRVRAVVSPKFRTLDNYDLAEIVIPELRAKGARVISAELTETRMYLKAVLESLELPVKGSRKVGDLVQAGLVISNSEVGSGALRIEPMTYRLICLNGAIAPTAMKKYHVGKAVELEAEVRAILSDETKRADDKAFWMKVRDVVRSAWDADLFAAQVAKLSEATQEEITSTKLDAVIEVVVDRYSLPKSLGGGILRNLITGGDLSKFGLANAITATANDEENYDLATELQRVGGRIIELPRTDWQKVAEAA